MIPNQNISKAPALAATLLFCVVSMMPLAADPATPEKSPLLDVRWHSPGFVARGFSICERAATTEKPQTTSETEAGNASPTPTPPRCLINGRLPGPVYRTPASLLLEGGKGVVMAASVEIYRERDDRGLLMAYGPDGKLRWQLDYVALLSDGDANSLRITDSFDSGLSWYRALWIDETDGVIAWLDNWSDKPPQLHGVALDSGKILERSDEGWVVGGLASADPARRLEATKAALVLRTESAKDRLQMIVSQQDASDDLRLNAAAALAGLGDLHHAIRVVEACRRSAKPYVDPIYFPRKDLSYCRALPEILGKDAIPLLRNLLYSEDAAVTLLRMGSEGKQAVLDALFVPEAEAKTLNHNLFDLAFQVMPAAACDGAFSRWLENKPDVSSDILYWGDAVKKCQSDDISRRMYEGIKVQKLGVKQWYEYFSSVRYRPLALYAARLMADMRRDEIEMIYLDAILYFQTGIEFNDDPALARSWLIGQGAARIEDFCNGFPCPPTPADLGFNLSKLNPESRREGRLVSVSEPDPSHYLMLKRRMGSDVFIRARTPQPCRKHADDAAPCHLPARPPREDLLDAGRVQYRYNYPVFGDQADWFAQVGRYSDIGQDPTLYFFSVTDHLEVKFTQEELFSKAERRAIRGWDKLRSFWYDPETGRGFLSTYSNVASGTILKVIDPKTKVVRNGGLPDVWSLWEKPSRNARELALQIMLDWRSAGFATEMKKLLAGPGSLMTEKLYAAALLLRLGDDRGKAIILKSFAHPADENEKRLAIRFLPLAEDNTKLVALLKSKSLESYPMVEAAAWSGLKGLPLLVEIAGKSEWHDQSHQRALAGIAMIPDSRAHKALFTLLEQMKKAGKSSEAYEVVSALTLRDDPEVVQELITNLELHHDLKSPEWQYFIFSRAPAIIPKAIAWMDETINDSDRDVIDDILYFQTGEDFGTDSASWRKWYEANKDHLPNPVAFD